MFVRERNGEDSDREAARVSWDERRWRKSEDTPASSAGGPSVLSQDKVAAEMIGGGCKEKRLLAAFNEVPLK